MKTIRTKTIANKKPMSSRAMLEEDNQKFVSSTLDIPETCTMFKPDPDKKFYVVDLLPYIVGNDNPKHQKGDTWLFRNYYTHRDIGPNREIVMCPKTFGKRCPICEESERLRRDNWDDEVGKQLRSKTRNLWNLKDLNDPDAGIQVWDVSDFLFAEELRNASSALEEDDPKEYYGDPEAGYSLKLTVEQKSGGGFKWVNVKRVDFVERKKQYKESIKEKTWCLDDFLKPALPYEALKDLFLQTSDDGANNNEESDNHERNGSMKRKPVTAKSKGIEVGDKVELDGLGLCDVAKISKDGTMLTVLDEDDEKHTVSVAEATLVEADEEPKSKKGAKAAPKKGKKVVDEDDEEEEEEEDSELEDGDEDEESEEDEDEESEEDEDEESELEEEDEEESDDDTEESDDDEDSEEDDEDSEEDDEDSEEDDDDEPAPKKRGRGRPPKKVVSKTKKRR